MVAVVGICFNEDKNRSNGNFSTKYDWLHRSIHFWRMMIARMISARGPSRASARSVKYEVSGERIQSPGAYRGPFHAVFPKFRARFDKAVPVTIISVAHAILFAIRKPPQLKSRDLWPFHAHSAE
jgi:hypothetical protein